ELPLAAQAMESLPEKFRTRFRAGTRICFGCTRRGSLAMLFALALPLFPMGSQAQMSGGQMGPEAGSELNGAGPMASPSPSGDAPLPPIQNLHIAQPIHGSMMVSPPYGNAPLRVGFFVLANDPEGFGFLTYSWNFGDGNVSSLPPEL